jgi:hypothetical protein
VDNTPELNALLQQSHAGSFHDFVCLNPINPRWQLECQSPKKEWGRRSLFIRSRYLVTR